jgi:pyruvate/2-oxoglutarate dehydrogenase complex dihydrolipoamide acyltransferase (E2) component
MAVGVYLPIWGMQMEEGRVVKWLVSEGDRVDKGDPLVEIETEKITNVVESPAAGIVAKIVAKEDEVLKITGLLAVILQGGEDPASVEMVIAQGAGGCRGVPSEGAADSVPMQTGVGPAASSGFTEFAEIKASPLAKKIAQEHGIDLKGIKGTGPEGRIVKEDILAYIEEAKSRPPAKVPETALQIVDKSFKGDIVLMSQTRKVIARRTLESIKAPQGTLTREVDLSEVLRFRKSIMPEFEQRYGLRLALTPIFVKALALAVKEVPIVNSRIEGDKVHISHKVHVGVVVGVKDGIAIPVIFNAHAKSLAEVAREWEDLSKRSAEGSLKLEEITGGTITISNVGNVGIDVFTPILNPPESAVLGITRTRQRPIVKDGQIVIGEMTYLCLTGDHRVMDAEPIGKFLTAMEKILQNPISVLL